MIVYKEVLAALPEDGIDRNNTITVFLMGVLPAAGGSAISVILYTCFVWAVLSLSLGRFEFRLTRSDRMLAWTFTIFVVLIIGTALAGAHVEETPRVLVWLLGFLSPWVLIPRLRARSNGNYLIPYMTGAAAGAIIACAIAVLQLMIDGLRPEAGAGNAAVFAMMSLCLMGLGGLNIGGGPARRPWLGLGALLGGGLAVLLSLTRGVALVVPPMLLLVLAYAGVTWRSLFFWRIVLFTFVIAGLVVFGAHHMLELRLDQTVREFEKILHGDFTSSAGIRLRLWSASMEAIVRSPIWGAGIQNRMDVLLPSLRQDSTFIHGFSHAHNGFLSFALDGGILVLAALIAVVCAPVVASLRAPHDENHRLRLFMALAVTGAYVLCGMTQIMFKHDVMDSFFIFFAIVVAASIPENRMECI